MKILKILVGVAFLLLCFTIVYYVLIGLPKIEREKERNLRIGILRLECEKEKHVAEDDFTDMLNSCKSEECTKNILDGSIGLNFPSDNYVKNCIIRKQKDYPEEFWLN